MCANIRYKLKKPVNIGPRGGDFFTGLFTDHYTGNLAIFTKNVTIGCFEIINVVLFILFPK